MKETRTLAMAILLLYIVTSTEAGWITTGNNMYSDIPGNIGIGTTSPKFDLDVRGEMALLNNDGTKGFRIQLRSDGVFSNGGSPDFNIRNLRTGTNVLSIDEETGNVAIKYSDAGSATLAVNGRVGIGTNDANLKLYVVDNSTSPVAFFDQNGDGWGIRVATSGEGNKPIFRAEAPQNNTVMTINANGRVGIGIVNPSERLSVDGDIKASASFIRQNSGTPTNPIPWVGGSAIQAECEAYRVGSGRPNEPLFETLAQSYGYLAGVSGDGFLTDGIGVYGEVTTGGSGIGVYGMALVETGTGVYGVSTGVQGEGVHGVSEAGGYGVKGVATAGGYGVYGITRGGSVDTAPHYGGYFEGRGEYSIGVYGRSYGQGAAAVKGESAAASSNAIGVHGLSDSGKGVSGYSNYGTALYGYSRDGIGVEAHGEIAGAFVGRVRITKLDPIPFGLPVVTEGSTLPGCNGMLGISVSSARFKEKIEPLKDDFHKILKAEPKSFTPKGRNIKGIGFIAEEFDELGLDHLLVYDEDDKPLSIHYEMISLYLLEVVKEQAETTRQLKAEIELLKHSVNTLQEQTKNDRSVLAKAIQ